MRFLIVDDDHTCRRIMQFFLKAYGECVTAACGTEAVEAYKTSLESGNHFDVVYLDMLMPDFNGIEVLSRFKENDTAFGIKQKIPVIMLTGEADITHINMSKSYGVAEYLLKPVQEERLLQGLERLELINTQE